MSIRILRGPSGTGRCMVAIVLACLLAGSTAFAQSGLSDWENVQNLDRGTRVVVKTVARDKYSGRLVNVTADSLAMDSDERGFPGRVTRRRTVRRAGVMEVRLRRQGASILVSGAIGAAAGAAIGGAIEASVKSGEDRGVALVVLIGLGFALGALIGRHTNMVKGRRVYVTGPAASVPSGADGAKDD